MRCRVLASGSRGNCALVRAGDLHLLVDAGLPHRELRARLEEARLPFQGIEHVLVTHGHLDHARSAGSIARRQDATVHAPGAILRNRSMHRAPRVEVLPIGNRREIVGAHGDRVTVEPVLLPHDCDPTLAFRIRHEERTLVWLTDMGEPREEVARALRGAHLLVLEFNYDERMLAEGPYPAKLKKRISGGRGHLSNTQSARMLEWLAGPELHTLVLAHLSETNNTPERAAAVARETLARLGREDVSVRIAEQHAIGVPLDV